MNRQQKTGGAMSMAGSLGMVVERFVEVNGGVRKAPLWWRVKNFLLHRLRNAPRNFAIRWICVPLGVITIQSKLFIRVIKASGEIIDYGLVGTRVVTTVGVGFIVDAFQNLVELENMKYHGFGTGTTAEAVGDTALVTELTTQYNPDNTRPTGTTTEGASANIYRTVATMTIDSGTPAVTEHGVFDQAANSGGVLLDRTVFGAINLVANDSIQATYELTLTAGS